MQEQLAAPNTSLTPLYNQPRLRQTKDLSQIFRTTDALCSSLMSDAGGLVARPCKTLEDLEAAYKLVYREYIRRGYCAPNPAEIHYSFYCTLPKTRTFILERRGVVVATISFLPDSPCGLPMDSSFSNHISPFRDSGRKLSEVGLLSLDSQVFSPRQFSLADTEKLSALFRIIRIMFDHARAVDTDDLVIVVNPKNTVIYDYLKFDRLGEQDTYGGANGAQAVALRMDFKAILPKLHAFFHQTYNTFSIERYFDWDKKTIHEFLFRKRPLWQKLPPSMQERIQSYLEIDLKHETFVDQAWDPAENNRNCDIAEKVAS